ncbi:type II toxin-antitoxin system VapC family toxin [Gracilimonas sp.]|uniref:type II toxin-antitoxin system VapC family toxin n=1 Tax=Gracilimonas sp. TaxID=1974203 RepID=UPI002872587C|nr:PIN domain-containing protein [Gracilimonas sp.]
MISTLIDAGPIIALFDRSDQYHRRVYEFMREFEGRLISTWPVLTEVSYMLDFHKQVQLDFLSWVSEGGIEVVNLEQWQLLKIREIMDKYDDLLADFADASLLVTAEMRFLDSIISLDNDFTVYKLGGGERLSNLLDT